MLAVLSLATLALLLVAASLGRKRDGPLFAAAKVGRIDLYGPIEESDEFLDELSAHEDDPFVRALVVRVDSPGGAVAPSQEMFEGLRRYRRNTGRPVVVSMGNIAASGGYYVAMAGDRVVANPGTLTGSIGVIWSFPDASRLLERIGIRMEVVKTGEMKDAGAPWRALTAEERKVLEATLEDVKLQFAEAVSEGRGMDLDRVLAVADGRVFSGREALTLGLVDTLGTLDDARQIAARLAGLDADAPLVSKHRERGIWDEFRRVSGRVRGLAEGTPRLEYRFR